MRRRPERTLALLLTFVILAAPTCVEAQVEARPSTPLLLATGPESFYIHPTRAVLEVAWQEQPSVDGGSTSKGSWTVVGVLGSLAGAWAGAHAGARLGLFNDSSSEDPEIQSVVTGALVGSTVGAASLVAAVDGRDGSFPGVFGGAAVGTVVGLVAVGVLNDSAGLVAFSLSQALGAAVGAAMTD